MRTVDEVLKNIAIQKKFYTGIHAYHEVRNWDEAEETILHLQEKAKNAYSQGCFDQLHLSAKHRDSQLEEFRWAYKMMMQIDDMLVVSFLGTLESFPSIQHAIRALVEFDFSVETYFDKERIKLLEAGITTYQNAQDTALEGVTKLELFELLTHQKG